MKCVISLFLLIFINCIYCSKQQNKHYKITPNEPPQQTTDGWQTKSLSGAGLDTQKLQNLLDKISDQSYQDIHSIVIIKDGYLVFEQYFDGYTFKYNDKEFKGNYTVFNRNTIHNLASVTKSVTSILTGIAFYKGFVDSVHQKMFRFFPQYASLNDSLKSKITLRHLLTMTAGLQWNEQDISYSEARNDIIQMFMVPDPVRYILSKAVIDKPGSQFYYNGGLTNLLGEVIHKTSGLRLDDFAKKYLFGPLGINRYKWIYFNKDMVYASGDLKLRPRDMAKLGYLMLNRGLWKNKRIIPARWVEESTTPYIHFNAKGGYGYQWWTKKYELGGLSINSYSARGWGGQNIIVMPELNSIVVITAGDYSNENPNDEMMYFYILPSLAENFKYDFVKITHEAPILDKIALVKPADNINPAIAKLSGQWYGRGDYIIAGQLVVEEIDSTEARIIYAWGAHPDGYFNKGWIHKTATVDSTGKIDFMLDNGASLTFKLDKDENVLIGSYRIGEVVSRLIFIRH